MTIQKTFNEVINFTRGTGAMRVNSAGLLVGIDFSSSSVVFGTGAKTFTLIANANVNRDWPVGSSIRAFSQVAPLGEMIGTVTSYDPVTQSLVMNVTSNTGTGTGTNWRIGSLEKRQTTAGVVSEEAATNLRTSWADMSQHGPLDVVLTPNYGLSPQGSLETTLLTESPGTVLPRLAFTTTIVQNQPITLSIYAKEVAGSSKRYLQLYAASGTVNATSGTNFDLATGTIVFSDSANHVAYVDPVIYANGFRRYSVTFLANATASAMRVAMQSSPTAPAAGTYTADGTGKIEVFGLEVTQAFGLTSSIPTNTAQATRNADVFALSASALTTIRQGQGAVITEFTSEDIGLGQKRAVRMGGAAGEIRIAKRGMGTKGSFSKMVEGADKIIMPVSVSGITVVNNGLETLPITATINERTGLPEQVTTSNAWAFNGSNQFGYVGLTTEERFLSSDFALWSGKGLGATALNACKWIATRFLLSSSVAGLIAVTDGASYRRVNTPVITVQTNSSTFGTISGGITRVVLVGLTGKIYTSDNQGETWTERSSGVTGNFQGAAWGPVGGPNGTFVVASSNGNSTRYSTDGGVTWLAVTGVGANGFNDVKFANGLFVLVGLGGVVYTSIDGAAYTAATNTNTTSNLNGVAYDVISGTWAACASGGVIIVATNPAGIWTNYNNATTPSTGQTGNFNEIEFFNGNFHAVTVGGNVTRFTPAVISFTTTNLGTNSTLTGISSNAAGTLMIVTGAGGVLSSTTDGLTYTPRASNGQTILGVAYGNGVYMFAGSPAQGSGYFATIAPDGTVTRRGIGLTSNAIQNARFINGFFYLTESANNRVIRTADGLNNTQVSWAGTSRVVNDIAGDGTTIVAVQDGSVYSYSLDNGLSFVPLLSFVGLVGNVKSIAVANGTWVVATQSGTTDGRIYTTTTPTNNSSWVQRYVGTNPFRSLIFSQRDQLWYALGDNGTVLFAADPTGTWNLLQNRGLAAISNTTLQASLNAGNFLTGNNRLALSYKANEAILSMNGASFSDGALSVPNITSVTLGENLNGVIKSIKFQEGALTAAELNAITGGL